jgi:hypothetical protein
MFLVNYVPSKKPVPPPQNMSLISTAEPLDYIRHKDLLAIGANILQVVMVGVGIFIFMMGKAKYKMLEPSGKINLKMWFCDHPYFMTNTLS